MGVDFFLKWIFYSYTTLIDHRKEWKSEVIREQDCSAEGQYEVGDHEFMGILVRLFVWLSPEILKRNQTDEFIHEFS